MPATTADKTQDNAPGSDQADTERWWWDEVGVLVEHEVWHLPRLADEQEAQSTH